MKYSKEDIAAKLQSDEKWLARGIIAIFNRQTEDEQSSETTNRNNAKGFTGCDAKFGSSLAKKLLKGYTLSPKQIEAAKNMMPKYAGQLYKVSVEKAALTPQAEA